MRFHALQQDVVPNDWKTNREEIESQLRAIDLHQGDFVVLPEMTDTGWSMEIEAITEIGTVDWATPLAKEFGVWMQVGWAKKVGSKARNCVTICSPDGLEVATYTKSSRVIRLVKMSITIVAMNLSLLTWALLESAQ